MTRRLTKAWDNCEDNEIWEGSVVNKPKVEVKMFAGESGRVLLPLLLTK